jgi:hypothetical protein
MVPTAKEAGEVLPCFLKFMMSLLIIPLCPVLSQAGPSTGKLPLVQMAVMKSLV